MNIAALPLDDLKAHFSMRLFLICCGAVMALLLLLLLILFLNRDYAVQVYNGKLPSKTIIVAWPGTATEDAAQEENGPVVADFAQTLIGRPDTSGAFTRNTNVPAKLARFANGMVKAPVDAIAEPSRNGLLPVRDRKQGLTAFDVYKKPYTPTGRPMIALVIEDIGISKAALNSVMRSMSPLVTLSFSPYTDRLAEALVQTRERGHEAWLSLPLETASFPLSDPGPHTIMIDFSERDNIARLNWILARPQGYVGFLSSYRQIFTSSSNDMRPVFGDIYNRGLAYVDNTNSLSNIAQTMAEGAGMPFGEVDVWLDRPSPAQRDIRAKFSALEALARENGSAIGVIQALPVSFQETIEWIDTLSSKNIDLAPLSAVIQ